MPATPSPSWGISPAPQARPDSAVLLIDAVINRQQDLAQRLAVRWIHRNGLAAFANLILTRLQQPCGTDGICWLHELLGLSGVESTASPQEPVPAEGTMGVGRLIREALSEALQPLRPQLSGQAPCGMALAAEVAADPWRLPADLWSGASGDLASDTDIAAASVNANHPAAAYASVSVASAPAPAPADLAGLRAWLHSDAA